MKQTISPANILAILKKDITDLKDVDYRDSLRDKLELDSLDLSLFFLNIQETYGVQVTDDDVAQLDSIEDVATWLQTKLN